MKIYLSGPMTGLPDFNYPAFNEAAQLLRAYGYEVFNPAEISPYAEDFDGNARQKRWEDFMRDAIVMLAQCDMIMTLTGWEKSRGATLEVYLATQLGMRVLPFSMTSMKALGSVA